MTDNGVASNQLSRENRPKLFLHIGTGKTGSSAIQQVLAANRTQLERRGVLIPDNELQLNGPTDGTQVAFFQALRPVTDAYVDLVTGRLEYLERAARHRGADAVVISAENLINGPEFPRLFQNAHRWFDVHVIAYIRRQDDFFLSSWAQWGHKKDKTSHEWATSTRRAGDWNLRVSIWESTLPDAEIIVRVYDRNRLVGGDVVPDFLDAIKVAPDGLTVDSGVELNARLNEIALRVSARNHALSADHNDNRFTDFMRQFGAPNVFQPTPTGLMWGREERMEVVDRYAESNEEIRKRYFPDLPVGGLFSTKFADDPAMLTQDEQFKLELDMIWTTLFRLHEALRPQEGRLVRFGKQMRPTVLRVRRLQVRR